MVSPKIDLWKARVTELAEVVGGINVRVRGVEGAIDGADPYTQYLTPARGDARYVAKGGQPDFTAFSTAAVERNRTGWGNYNDTAAAQPISGNTRTALTVNAASKLETERPADVTTFWDAANGKITGRKGDGLIIKIEADFTPDDATASYLLIEVDIGGTIGVVDRREFAITKGAMMAHPVSWTFLAYTFDTWAANGARIFVFSDGPGNFSKERIVVGRFHKAVNA